MSSQRKYEKGRRQRRKEEKGNIHGKLKLSEENRSKH
jgi:hypothetical protein